MVEKNLSENITYTTTSWFFTRGGTIDLSRGSMTVIGNAGVYWSSTSSISTGVSYSLDLDAVGAFPSFIFTRALGLSVRCVTASSPLTLTPSHQSFTILVLFNAYEKQAPSGVFENIVLDV